MLTAQRPQGLTVWSSQWTVPGMQHAPGRKLTGLACSLAIESQSLSGPWQQSVCRAQLSSAPGLEPPATSLRGAPKASTACCCGCSWSHVERTAVWPWAWPGAHCHFLSLSSASQPVTCHLAQLPASGEAQPELLALCSNVQLGLVLWWRTLTPTLTWPALGLVGC